MTAAKLVTHHFILCPHCGKGESRIDHLFYSGGSFGPWYCDECGKAFRGEIREIPGFADNQWIEVHGKQVMVEAIEGGRSLEIAFLRLGNVLFAVKGVRLQDDDDDAHYDHQRYYYEEHTCPMNIVSEALEVYDETGDGDKHGMFKYLGSEPWMDEIPADVVRKYL